MIDKGMRHRRPALPDTGSERPPCTPRAERLSRRIGGDRPPLPGAPSACSPLRSSRSIARSPVSKREERRPHWPWWSPLARGFRLFLLSWPARRPFEATRPGMRGARRLRPAIALATNAAEAAYIRCSSITSRPSRRRSRKKRDNFFLTLSAGGHPLSSLE